jgi:hypothetical protein
MKFCKFVRIILPDIHIYIFVMFIAARLQRLFVQPNIILTSVLRFSRTPHETSGSDADIQTV